MESSDASERPADADVNVRTRDNPVDEERLWNGKSGVWPSLLHVRRLDA
jgi:hypothetical protein